MQSSLHRKICSWKHRRRVPDEVRDRLSRPKIR